MSHGCQTYEVSDLWGIGLMGFWTYGVLDLWGIDLWGFGLMGCRTGEVHLSLLLGRDNGTTHTNI